MLKQHLVFKSAGLPFVGVAYNVLGLALNMVQLLPLLPRRVSRAAAA